MSNPINFKHNYYDYNNPDSHPTAPFASEQEQIDYFAGVGVKFSEKDIFVLEQIARINSTVWFKKGTNLLVVSNPETADNPKNSIIAHVALQLNRDNSQELGAVFPVNFKVLNLSMLMMQYKDLLKEHETFPLLYFTTDSESGQSFILLKNQPLGVTATSYAESLPVTVGEIVQNGINYYKVTAVVNTAPTPNLLGSTPPTHTVGSAPCGDATLEYYVLSTANTSKILGQIKVDDLTEDEVPPIPVMPDIQFLDERGSKSPGYYSDIEFRLDSGSSQGRAARVVEKSLLSSGQTMWSIKGDGDYITLQSESSKVDPKDGATGPQANTSLLFGAQSSNSTTSDLWPNFENFETKGPVFSTGKIKIANFRLIYNQKLDNVPDGNFGNFLVSIDAGFKVMRFRDVEESAEFFIKIPNFTGDEDTFPPYNDAPPDGWGHYTPDDYQPA